MHGSTEHLRPPISEPLRSPTEDYLKYRWSIGTTATNISTTGSLGRIPPQITFSEGSAQWAAPPVPPVPATSRDPSSERSITPQWLNHPVPPIPSAQDRESWVRRSLKRQASYTSHMSGSYPHSHLSVRSVVSGTGTVVQISPGVEALGNKKGVVAVVRATSDAVSIDPEEWRRNVRELEHSAFESEEDWDESPQNPQNWSRIKQWLHTGAAAGLAFTITLASSITTLSIQDVQDDLHIRPLIARLTTALFLLGLAFGPFLFRLCSKLLGRKPIIAISFPLFALLTLDAALVQSHAGRLIACRCAAGLLASPALSASGAMVLDLWKRDERSLPAAIFYGTLLLGPVLGALLSGVVTETMGWRWTQHVVLFASAAAAVPVVFVSETSESAIRRPHHGNFKSLFSGMTGEKTGILKPLTVLFTKTTTLVLNLYSGFVFATLYASFVAWPRIFAKTYGFGLSAQGFVYTSLVVGILLGILVLFLHHLLVQRSGNRKMDAQRATADFQEKRYLPPNPPTGPIRHPHIRNTTSRNTLLALAASNHLSTHPRIRVSPETITAILHTNPPYHVLCEELERAFPGLDIDRNRLARVLVDALPPNAIEDGVESGTEDGCSVRTQRRGGLARSRSLHRNAAIAALDTPRTEEFPRDLPSVEREEASSLHRDLYPALVGTLIAPAGVLLFAFTSRASSDFHWTVPCVGLGIFTFAAVLSFVNIQLYLAERFGNDGVAAGTVVRYAMSCAFVLAVGSVYERVGEVWGSVLFTLVLGVLGAGIWVVVAVEMMASKGSRSRDEG